MGRHCQKDSCRVQFCGFGFDDVSAVRIWDFITKLPQPIKGHMLLFALRQTHCPWEYETMFYLKGWGCLSALGMPEESQHWLALCCGLDCPNRFCLTSRLQLEKLVPVRTNVPHQGKRLKHVAGLDDIRTSTALNCCSSDSQLRGIAWENHPV